MLHIIDLYYEAMILTYFLSSHSINLSKWILQLFPGDLNALTERTY